MKLLLPAFIVVFLLSFIDAKAQQPHFIYIQTENKQPFYVRMDNTIYSSTVSGYVIISKLVDSTYNFTVGFLKNQWPQQKFTCTINKNDKGFVLKNFGDKGWGLFNLETMDVLMANVPTDSKKFIQEERTDSFSNMLSIVVKDPTIKEKRIINPDKSAQSLENNNTTIITGDAITKLLQKTNKKGTELVYLDLSNGNQDTIRIFIPYDKTNTTVQQDGDNITDIDTTNKEPSKKAEDLNQTLEDTISKNIVAINTKPQARLDTIHPAKKFSTTDSNNSATVVVRNNNCSSVANDNDFLKLRKKMASAGTDNEMIKIARKVFKSKCFTTIQIKNLSFLFLNDEGRYNFFDMAYSFVSDSENFSSLASQLLDPYYLNRFKALVNSN